MHWKLALLLTILIALGIVLFDSFMPSPAMRALGAGIIDSAGPLLALYWVAISLRSFRQPRIRMSWLLIGISILAFSIYWVVNHAVLSHGHYSLGADVLFLLSFTLLWVGLLVRPGQYPREFIGKAIIVFDLLISAGAAISITIQLSFPALFFASHTPQPLQMQGMAYPVVALLTLICINLLLLQATPRPINLPRALLVLGIGFLLMGGMWSVYLALSSIRVIPFLCQVLWPVGFLLYGVAARWEAAVERRTLKLGHNVDPFPSLAGVLVPVVLVLTAMLLALNSLVEPDIPFDSNRFMINLLTIAGLILLTMIRQVLTFESNRKLYVALQYLYTQMAQNAATDSLTGLVNHGYFMERLDQELHRARRYRRPLSIIFADLDHFKQINDTYGHRAGDQALQVVAQAMERSVRDVDLVARYGGEEFVLLLPETSLVQATLLAERLCVTVCGLALPFLQEGERRLTLSCGVTEYPDIATSTDGLLHCADQAMYRAKEGGGNRVVVAASQQLPA